MRVRFFFVTFTPLPRSGRRSVDGGGMRYARGRGHTALAASLTRPTRFNRFISLHLNIIFVKIMPPVKKNTQILMESWIKKYPGEFTIGMMTASKFY